MTNQDLISLWNTINNSLSELKGVKFSYGIARNHSIIKRELEAIEKASAPTEAFLKFDEERLEIVKKYAKKDKDNNPVVEGQNYVVDPAKQKKFDSEFKELVKIHSKTVKERENQIKDYAKLLKEETDIKLFKIKIEDLPEDISVSQMSGIALLLDDKE